MNILSKVSGLDNIPQVLSILMSADNALNYNKEKLLSKYVEGVTEEEAIALELCGTSGKELVLGFIQEGLFVEKFFTNISFNSERCIPLIVRAINLAYINHRIKQQE